MIQYQVTVDAEGVQQGLQRDDGSAELVGLVLNQPLDAQVSDQLRAGRRERTEDRHGHCVLRSAVSWVGVNAGVKTQNARTSN